MHELNGFREYGRLGGGIVFGGGDSVKSKSKKSQLITLL